MEKWKEKILEFDPCKEAIPWLREQDSAEAAWNNCECGDWMFWLAGKLSIDRRLVVRVAALCASEVLVYVPEGEHRPRIAIEAALRWCDDNADAAYTAAYVAAAAAAAANDVYAAAAAATSSAYAAVSDYAAYAADAAYAAAAACAAAADAAYYSSVSGDSLAAKKASFRKSADIVRSVILYETVRSKLCQ